MPTLKDLLQTDYNSLLKMALSIDPINGQDYLHEAFLKIPENKEVNATYIYFTIKTLFLDDKRKSKEDVYDFSNYDIPESESFNYESGLNEIKSKLTTFQAILIDLVRNHKLTLLQISKETNIEYKVIYRNFKKIQKLCKDLEI
jgi:hypothetical protein